MSAARNLRASCKLFNLAIGVRRLQDYEADYEWNASPLMTEHYLQSRTQHGLASYGLMQELDSLSWLMLLFSLALLSPCKVCCVVSCHPDSIHHGGSTQSASCADRNASRDSSGQGASAYDLKCMWLWPRGIDHPAKFHCCGAWSHYME